MAENTGVLGASVGTKLGLSGAPWTLSSSFCLGNPSKGRESLAVGQESFIGLTGKTGFNRPDVGIIPYSGAVCQGYRTVNGGTLVTCKIWAR